MPLEPLSMIFLERKKKMWATSFLLVRTNAYEVYVTCNVPVKHNRNGGINGGTAWITTLNFLDRDACLWPQGIRYYFQTPCFNVFKSLFTGLLCFLQRILIIRQEHGQLRKIQKMVGFVLCCFRSFLFQHLDVWWGQSDMMTYRQQISHVFSCVFLCFPPKCDVFNRTSLCHINKSKGGTEANLRSWWADCTSRSDHTQSPDRFQARSRLSYRQWSTIVLVLVGKIVSPRHQIHHPSTHIPRRRAKSTRD